MAEKLTKRIMLTVAYDGTNYCGWQIQPNGITIEAVLNEKLSELLKENISVIGASRTDSGVPNGLVLAEKSRRIDREYKSPPCGFTVW